MNVGEATAPRRPPTPSAAVMYPTAPSPASSNSNTVTTIRTFRQPRTNPCATISATTRRRFGSARRAAKPASSGRLPVGAGTATRTRPSTRTLAKIPAAAASAAAPTPKTTPGSAIDTSSPAPSGPTSVPIPSTVEVAPFEAISSAGVRARDGSNAWSAGRTSVEATPTGAARAMMRVSFPPIAKTAAEAASARAPTSDVMARKRSRRKRSPRAAANGARSAAGSRRTSPAMPTASVPPASYAKTPSATKCIHSAVTAAPQASSARRSCRFRQMSTTRESG